MNLTLEHLVLSIETWKVKELLIPVSFHIVEGTNLPFSTCSICYKSPSHRTKEIQDFHSVAPSWITAQFEVL
jgi:hypothetical protein